MTGIVSHLKGLSAEDTVEQAYEAQGAQIIARRWKGAAGELDLVAVLDNWLVVIEVKASKTIERALHSLGGRQIARILASAEDFLRTCPQGQLTNVRFDVVAVSDQGTLETVENALAA